MKNSILAFLFLIISSNSFAQKSVISGNARTYSGDSLTIFSLRDDITKKRFLQFSSFVDTPGNFKFEIDTKQTTVFYIDLEVFRGIIFVEPDDNYEIILPQKTLKDKLDLHNPFFVPEQFFIRIISGDKSGLNRTIAEFEKLSSEIFEDYYRKKITISETANKINTIEKQFGQSKSTFLNDYVGFSCASLRRITYEKNERKLILKYFNRNAQAENPAYNEAFKRIVSASIEKLSVNDDFLTLIDQKKYPELNLYLAKDSIFSNNDFREYVLLNSLTKIFYEYSSSKKNVLELLVRASKEMQNETHRNIARDFAQAASELLIGQIAPDFEAHDINGRSVKLSDFREKFVYLNFYEPGNYAGEKGMSILKNLYEQKIDMLQIVTIWCGASGEEMKKFVTDNNIQNPVLFCADKTILEKYKIRLFPAYFLIDPDGFFSAAPAAAPDYNFEAFYFQIYQNRKREQIRNGNKKLGNN